MFRGTLQRDGNLVRVVLFENMGLKVQRVTMLGDILGPFLFWLPGHLEIS
jgi:hypothetical protein